MKSPVKCCTITQKGWQIQRIDPAHRKWGYVKMLAWNNIILIATACSHISTMRRRNNITTWLWLKAMPGALSIGHLTYEAMNAKDTGRNVVKIHWHDVVLEIKEINRFKNALIKSMGSAGLSWRMIRSLACNRTNQWTYGFLNWPYERRIVADIPRVCTDNLKALEK